MGDITKFDGLSGWWEREVSSVSPWIAWELLSVSEQVAQIVTQLLLGPKENYEFCALSVLIIRLIQLLVEPWKDDLHRFNLRELVRLTLACDLAECRILLSCIQEIWKIFPLLETVEWLVLSCIEMLLTNRISKIYALNKSSLRVVK
jgi:hypothetical protein